MEDNSVNLSSFYLCLTVQLCICRFEGRSLHSAPFWCKMPCYHCRDCSMKFYVLFVGRGDYESALKYGFLNLDRDMMNSKAKYRISSTISYAYIP